MTEHTWRKSLNYRKERIKTINAAWTDGHWSELSKHAAYFVRVCTVKIERMQLIEC